MTNWFRERLGLDKPDFEPVFIGVDHATDGDITVESRLLPDGRLEVVSITKTPKSVFGRSNWLVKRESYKDILERQPKPKANRAAFPNPEPMKYRPKV